MNAIVPVGASALIPTSMEGAMRLAEMMARGKLVPSHLRDSPGDCLMVVEQSMRWGMSPFAVAQSTSVIQGKLMFEGKLVSAALHSSGLLDGRLEYDFSGEGAGRRIVVRGKIKGGRIEEMEIKLADAKTSNQMWTKQPDQQLVYFATRAWARRHAAEVMLGVYSPEEFDAAAQPAFTGTTIDAEPVYHGQPRDTARAIGDELPTHALDATPAPKTRKTAEVIDELDAAFAAAQTREAVDAVVASDTCQKALDYARNGHKQRLDGIMKAALDRTAEAPTTDTDDGWPGPDTTALANTAEKSA